MGKEFARFVDKRIKIIAKEDNGKTKNKRTEMQEI